MNASVAQSQPSMEPTQYLTFKLEDEVFALGISKVREVLDAAVPGEAESLPLFEVT